MNVGDFALVTGGPFSGAAGIITDVGGSRPRAGRSARVVIRWLSLPDTAPCHPSVGVIGVAPFDVVALPAVHLEAALQAFMRGDG